MTEEQKELAAENEKLIWKFMQIKRLDEDFYFILAPDYLKAVKDYDPSKGKFSTFAFKYMSLAMMREFQNRNHHVRKIHNENMISLDYMAENTQDHMAGTQDTFDDAMVSVLVNYIMSVCDERQKLIIGLRILGYTYKEIADRLGVSTWLVNRTTLAIYENMRDKYKYS